jgi:hypothetical protein
MFESYKFHLIFNWNKLFCIYVLNPQFLIIHNIQVSFQRYVELLIEKYLIDIIVNIIININFII